jgi:ATP-dependent Lon protease
MSGVYKEKWDVDVVYKRGDIVYIMLKKWDTETFDYIDSGFINYYMCLIDHTSCSLVRPNNPEEIYWELISPDFLTTLQENYYFFKLLNTPPQPPQPIIPFDPINAYIYTQNSQGPTNSTLNPNAQPFVPTSGNVFGATSGNVFGATSGNVFGATSGNNITIAPITTVQANFTENRLTKRIRKVEQDLEIHKKKRKTNDKLSMTDKILLLNVDNDTKLFLLDKYDKLRLATGSDYSKGIAWLNNVLNLPFGKYNKYKVKNTDSTEDIQKYFKTIKSRLDTNIHGLDYVKEEIMEFIAKKIANPNSKTQVLALRGAAGVGKTALLQSLAHALELPFYQINCGGLNDVSILTGHSETYVSSKPGKIVEILQNANCMNPIIYLDEIDKISSQKGKEINGILTHMLDEQQNNKFQDNYVSNINIDLSHVFFVVAFNDLSEVDPIVADRMKIIEIKNPSIEEKVVIANTKIIPEIIKSINLEKHFKINLDTELIKYIITNKLPTEDGVRTLKRNLEKLFNKLNYLMMTGTLNETSDITETTETTNPKNKTITITKKFIDSVLESVKKDDTSFLHMYV